MNDLPAFLGSEYHCVVAGETGAGKTVVCNALHTGIRDRLSVFFNTQHKGYVRGETIDYRGAEDNDKIARALDQGATKLDIRPRSVVPDEEHEDLTDLLFRLAKEGVRMAVFNDEVHEYGNQKGSSVHRMHQRGRDPGEGPGGMKVFSISQRYVNHETSARSECKYFLQVGLPASQDRDALEDERSYPFDMVADSHDNQRFIDTVEGGETVSRAFSVEKNGEIIFGPKRVPAKYAE